MIKDGKCYCDNCYEFRDALTLATHIQEPEPYAEDVREKIIICDLCDECYSESVMDI